MENKGLEEEYLKNVCKFLKGNKACRYVRIIFKFKICVCCKNTALGIAHSKRIDRLMQENKDGKLSDIPIACGDNCEGRAHEFMDIIGEQDLKN